MQESALYKSIIAEALEIGVAQERAQNIYQILVEWLGAVDPNVSQRLATFPNGDLVAKWNNAAIRVRDVEAARQLLDQILQTLDRLPTTDAQRAH